MKDLLTLVLGNEDCAKSILNFDFQIDCIKLFISKGLSYGIVGGAILVKVPQILQITISKSVKGLSLLSLALETVAIFIALAYNYRLQNPFSTYGEGAFLAIQNSIIMALICAYGKNYRLGVVLAAVSYQFVYALLTPSIINKDLLDYLQLTTIFIGIASKLPQIYSNWSSKSTGQLSIVTTFLQFAGTLARILTTIQEVPDPKLIAGVVCAAALNGIILVQIVIYSTKSTKEKKRK